MSATILDLDSIGFWDSVAKTTLNDKLFVTPTDTVYGLGAALANPTMRARLNALKARPDQAIIILVNNWDDVVSLANPTDRQKELLSQHWPNSVTFLLPTHDSADKVALRWPSDPFMKKWLKHLGGPMLSTSANLHGDAPLSDSHAALAVFGQAVDLYVITKVGGPKPASTLVDLTTNPPTIVRQGAYRFTY